MDTSTTGEILRQISPQIPDASKLNHTDHVIELVTGKSSWVTIQGTMCCIICGSMHMMQYTELASWPQIRKEIQELLKITLPQDDCSISCGRCLGLMKEFLSVKIKIINLHRSSAKMQVINEPQPNVDHSPVYSDGEHSQDVETNSGSHHKKFTVNGCGADAECDQPSLKCQRCDKTFVDMKRRLDHEKVHRYRKTYKCQYCDKICVRLRHIKEHESIHTGEKPHKCQYCDKKFRSKSTVKSHELFVHTNKLNQFKCQYCDKGFKRKCTWLLHEKRHTGQNGHLNVSIVIEHFILKVLWSSMKIHTQEKNHSSVSTVTVYLLLS
ncbi:zinc finger protein 528 [Lingula anatina]|uniref:Zinc finger protein 528 n=1 Tax=Lingula anatina TaxID=7574 RepID=A0A1S3I8C6_LINAN|nr:zinc finger protein 528 [Lingula anatina]|eukprot:XP_013394448.1 zinc finger protein 528 [Lingula anatina]